MAVQESSVRRIHSDADLFRNNASDVDSSVIQNAIKVSNMDT
jgi:hypothetical protein